MLSRGLARGSVHGAATFAEQSRESAGLTRTETPDFLSARNMTLNGTTLSFRFAHTAVVGAVVSVVVVTDAPRGF